MKYIFSFALLMALVNSAFSQRNNAKPTLNDLSLKWQVIENNHDNKARSLAQVTFTTRGDFSLPAKGWKLYFNFLEPVLSGSVTQGLEAGHVNGDLYYLAPTANFKGIGKKDSLVVQLVALNWLVNKTDSPVGFYLVWDNAPNKYYALNDPILVPSTEAKQFARTPLDHVPATTPALTYEQNKIIRDIPADSLTEIFPTPVNYTATAAKFSLDAGVPIIADDAFKTSAGYLKSELAKLLLPTAPSTQTAIRLVKKQMSDEAYELSVTDKAITISASSNTGIFYGIQSLKTLIAPQAYAKKQRSITIDGVTVTDQPRFGYRAFMLDVGRNFQPKKEILRLLDLMALYKLNVFRFHLTDDEGWRLEIPSLPELTAVGGKRGHTLDNKQYLQPSLGSGAFTNNNLGRGYYTRADYIEILKYAAVRHIRVIPEIESPGHARAAVVAMNARYAFYAKQGKMAQARQYLLHDLKDSSKYSSVQYWNDNVIDVSLPSTYNFVTTVIREVKKMYAEANAPLQTIHFGGDEVPAGVWERSPAFTALMKRDASVKSTDDLWTYFYGKVDQILKANDLYLTAWEEVGTRKVVQNGVRTTIIDKDRADKNIHLDVWNNVLGWGAEDLAYKLANTGYKVILSNVTNLYFDMAYNKAFDEPGYYWGGYSDVNTLFRFIPYNYIKNVTTDRLGNPINKAAFATKEQLTAAGKENIIGLQGALWSENLRTTARMEYMLLPKLLGFAERAWAKDPAWATETDTLKSNELFDADWAAFTNVLGKRELPRLTYYAGGFNYRIPGAGAVNNNGEVSANSELPGFTIRYTIDGTDPVISSPVYTSPVTGKKVKLALFNNAGRSGPVVATVGDK